MNATTLAEGSVTTHAVRFYSEGHLLGADLYLPVAPSNTNLPGIVLCHGYFGVRNLYLPDTARLLASQGAAVLAFDYKGWGDSEGKRYRLSPFSRVADVKAAVTALARRAEVDSDRISLFGWSYGASVAITATAIDQRVRAVVSVFGVGHGVRWLRSVRDASEWRDVISTIESDRECRNTTGSSSLVPRLEVLKIDDASLTLAEETRARTAGRVADVVPLEFFDDTLDLNAEWFIPHVSPRPVLIVACEYDEVVPVEESRRLYDNAEEPRELVMLSGVNHYGAYFGEGLTRVISEASAFLVRNELLGRGIDND